MIFIFVEYVYRLKSIYDFGEVPYVGTYKDLGRTDVLAMVCGRNSFETLCAVSSKHLFEHRLHSYTWDLTSKLSTSGSKCVRIDAGNASCTQFSFMIIQHVNYDFLI